MVPVATAIYSQTDAMGFPVLTILGTTGSITISAIDTASGSLSGTFSFSGPGGDVTGGTFSLTGMPVITPP